MLELNFHSFLSEFNGSKFIVYGSLLVFSLLLALRLDKFIIVNYAIVFLPLWFGEVCVLFGFVIGLISFIIHPPSRSDINLRNDFYEMCFQTLEHVFLLMFQLLLYLKIEYYDIVEKEQQIRLTWLLVFAPLFVQSFLAMIVAIWCIRREKSFEFEMFFAVNIIQFVFLAFKLDNKIHWNWALVLVPTWILFSLFLLCSTYSMTIALFLNRTFYAHEHLQNSRRPRLCVEISHVILSAPLLLHLLLLVGKLDAMDSINPHPGTANTPFLLIGLPLNITLLILLLLSFGSRSGNVWWFGIRQSFCNFIFELCPSFQYYANISCKFGITNEYQTHNQRQIRRIRMRQSNSSNIQSNGNNGIRVYGVEEATSSWMVSAMEEQRIIIEEEEVICNFDQLQNSKHQKKGKEKNGNNQEQNRVINLTIHGTIETPD